MKNFWDKKFEEEQIVEVGGEAEIHFTMTQLKATPVDSCPDSETPLKFTLAQGKETKEWDPDNGKVYHIFNVTVDPGWRETVPAKKPPLAYWFKTRKGRKAWLKKYIPGISHGSKCLVYFNTPSGPLGCMPSWATYVELDPDGGKLLQCTGNHPLKVVTNRKV
ncbi:1,4-alpha-glucan-branching enzyme 3, chloroplastic/amyloplastic [Quillaja saponaria]|uniref:1,4-alpha-glucan-branching enzyme 3, chloroplastic/amyloplastic n=1 Tax=Quillaja saponaria TaxID=32244 RepID=A0AAD7VDJ6_QUISA|nr:1,4-alpha-glucan-branching enzyme 3, chloroplastic/amyloplastic [Quillaja saponaria]